VLPEEYDLLIKEIFDRLAYNGWDFKGLGGKKAHGFDKMGSLVTSLLYLPCQAKDRRSSRLKAYKKGRRILDPGAWLDNLLDPPVEQLGAEASLVPSAEPAELEQHTPAPSPSSPISDCDQIERKRALAVWSHQRLKPGHGHKAFWTLALHLAKSGVSESELEDILWTESFNARSTKERQQEIPGILGELRKRGHFGSIPIPHSPAL